VTPLPTDVPRLIDQAFSGVVARLRDAQRRLGYSQKSLATLMSRYPDRWPRPAALLRVGRVWQLLWDMDELLEAAPATAADARLGGASTISDPDGAITCLECRQRFRNLGRHLSHAHAMTADEYRAAHQLPATGALMADAQRSEGRARMLDTDTSHLDAYRDPEHLDELRVGAVESLRETADYERVRAARLPGRRYAAQVMSGRRRTILDDRVCEHGWDGLEAAIAGTRHLSVREATEATGLSETSLRRWRDKLS